nr:EOG090X0D82 [Moina brachiata]
MFGLIVSGRLVQTDFKQISSNQFTITIPDADNINHVVVFLTGITPFPDGYGGSVYFRWPEASHGIEPVWQLLGFLTNNKPSSIYRITGLKKSNESSISSPFTPLQIYEHHHAEIGISIERLDILAAQSPNAITEPSNTSTFQEFAGRALENLLNYAGSYAVTQAEMTPNPNEAFVPMSVLRRWYETFLRKLQMNPQFWRT